MQPTPVFVGSPFLNGSTAGHHNSVPRIETAVVFTLRIAPPRPANSRGLLAADGPHWKAARDDPQLHVLGRG